MLKKIKEGVKKVLDDMDFQKFLPPNQDFEIVVDYDLPLEKMVEEAHFDKVGFWINRVEADFFTEKCFPTSTKGKKKFLVRLYHPDTNDTKRKVRNKFAKTEFKHADVRILLTFAAKFPEMQKYRPILELGEYKRIGGYREAVWLTGSTFKENEDKSKGELGMPIEDGVGERSLDNYTLRDSDYFASILVLVAKEI